MADYQAESLSTSNIACTETTGASITWEKTFLPFPRLAPELRQAIWRLAIPLPRHTVELHYDYSSPKIFCILRLHALFHVNREARGEAARGYNKLSFKIAGLETKTEILFNSQEDILYLNPWFLYVPYPDTEDENAIGPDDITLQLAGLAASLAREDRERIQRLAIGVREWQLFDTRSAFARVLRQFSGLKHLTLAIQEGRRRSIGDRALEDPGWGLRKEHRSLREKMEDIFDRGKRQDHSWVPPEVEVMRWERHDEEAYQDMRRATERARWVTAIRPNRVHINRIMS